LRAEPRGLSAGSHDIRFHVTADDDPEVSTHEKSIFFSRKGSP
jgi:hypothetical protein